ncbi:hypothetical protein [Ornithinibacillus californiensis]|uniref:hypothetical protein n=1 Tax=Ornithinibacillus californiensis TaxID=161536 RepID=UPI0012ECBD93|nr:hypothetical protein [Ornithinibacillus californiensis]
MDVYPSGLLVANSVDVLLVALPLSYCGIILVSSLIMFLKAYSKKMTPASSSLFMDVYPSGLLVADSVEVMLVSTTELLWNNINVIR